MKVALDNTFLSPIFAPKAQVRPDPGTGEETPYARDKLRALVDQLSERRDTILVPTPALTEMLIAVPDFAEAIKVINESSAFEIAGFDGKCAIETDDDNQRNNAQKIGPDVKSTWELELPDKYAQTDWLE